MRREWNILHLTDLHFGRLTEADDSLFLDDNKESVPNSLRESVVNRFYNILQQGGDTLKADAVAVTGDITTRGAEDGFQIFAAKTAPYLKKLVTNPTSICIVPGNHDVAWNLRKSDENLFDKKFERFNNMVQQVGSTTCLLPTGTVNDTVESGLDFHEVGKDDSTPVYIDEKKKLLILCINSAIRCGEVNEYRRSQIETPLNDSLKEVEGIKERLRFTNPDAKEKLELLEIRLKHLKERAAIQTVFDVAHVTESQLMRLSSKLRYLQQQYFKEWDSFLRVAIMHHHLMPFARQATEHKTYDLITDAANVRDFLTDFRFHIVLTGHKHQPYAEVYMAPNSKLLLVAGGPTVGGMPVRGHTQGFRYLKVVSENGRLSVRLAEINLLDTSAVNQPETQIKKSLEAAKEYVLEEPRPARFCLIPSPSPMTYNATEDLSDESLMFINVVGCREARKRVKTFLQEQIRTGVVPSLNYVGLYDLYGHYDLLVRIDDPSLKGNKGIDLLSEVQKDLRKHNMLHRQGAEFTTINLLDAHPFSGERGTHRHNLFPSQQHYEDLRSHRAFILVTKTSRWGDTEIENVKKMVRHFYEENREKLSDASDWSLSWGERDIIIEVLVRCGQYYNLQDLTRRLEDLVDLGDRQKMTHIVYHHEEYCPLSDEQIVDSVLFHKVRGLKHTKSDVPRSAES
jgi:3',5'-cyclic AMP phosphodiesterase CpdA